MDVDLPPVIAVRRLLRQQQARKDAFRAWLDASFQQDWASADTRAKPPPQRVHKLANSFLKELAVAEAFEVRQQGSLDRLRLKSEVRFRADGYVLWPLTVGRNGFDPNPAFTEQHLMLVQSGGRFTANKAAMYEAPSFFSWTRHALERVCERDEIGNDVHGVLATSTVNLAKALSLAITLELTKYDEDGEPFSRTAWIPYRGGLVIINNRVALANPQSQQIGWKFSFNKRHFSNGFIKPANIKPTIVKTTLSFPEGAADYRARNIITVSAWSVTTFISDDQLSKEQRSYKAMFNVLSTELKGIVTESLFTLNFDPEYLREGINVPDGSLSESASDIIDKLKNIIRLSSFKSLSKNPINHILDFDVSSTKYRSFISEMTVEGGDTHLG